MLLGSGKTYSMLGQNWTESNPVAEESEGAAGDNMGIIPRCLADIFDVLNEKATQGTIDFSLRE